MKLAADDIVDLDRCFIEVDPDNHDLDELRELASYGGFYGGTLSWESLWKSRAIVVLAEAGAGKTTELKAQTDELLHAGKAAFFIPIEELANGDMDQSLRLGDEKRFDNWLRSSDTGYFLLDSVDETRLVDKSFEVAIKTLLRRIESAATRCRIVITCRFNDWQWHIDQDTITGLLPRVSSQERQEPLIEATDDGLLNPFFAEDEDEVQFEIDDHDECETAPVYRLVALAPLGPSQWRILSDAHKPNSTKSFVQAIHDCNAEDSASRPLDLVRLIKYWDRFGELGTLSERLQYDATQRLTETNPKYQAKHKLALARAMAGTEVLAAALTICRFRSIRLPGAATDARVRDDCLDARSALDDWTDPELAALLHRPMFHGTSYGCVGFHHRNMQPYFAAKFLLRLSQSSLSYKRLKALLFGRIGSQSILRPSMAAVAAWLSMWEPRVYQWLLLISPETLMANGDPEAFSDQQCGEVLTAYCEKYSGRTDTGLRLHREQALRLARPSLSLTIRALWHAHSQFADQRLLLLRMVEYGPIPDATEIAIAAALDASLPSATQEYALQAIAAAASVAEKRRLLDALLENVATMDARTAGTITRLFYPSLLGNGELHQLVKSVPPTESGVWRNDLKRVIVELVESLDDETAVSFVHEWAPLLAATPHVRHSRAGASERYLWLFRPVGLLCQRLLTTRSSAPDTAVATAVETVARAKQYQVTRYANDVPNLRTIIANNSALNQFFFWRAVRRVAERNAAPITDWWTAHDFGSCWALGAADVGWLTDVIHGSEDKSDRRVALSALISLRSFWEKDDEVSSRVLAATAAANLDEELSSLIQQANKPTKYSKMDERLRRKVIIRREKDKQSWRDFRDRHERHPELLSNQALADTDEGFWDRYNFVKWLRQHRTEHGSWGAKNWRPLREGFSENVVVAARDAIVDYWRMYTPPLESEKADPGQHSHRLDVGVSGLYFLVDINPDWTATLSHTDAKTAMHYALEECGHLPSWAFELFDAFPDVANTVVRRQLRWDFEQSETQPYRFGVLDTMRYGDLAASGKFVPLLMDELVRREPASATALRFCLDRLMRSDAASDASLTKLAKGRAAKAHQHKNTDHACLWLSIMLCRNPREGISLLLAWLDESEPEERDALFVSAVSALFDHDGPRYPPDTMSCLTIPYVGELVSLSYAHVPVDGDRVSHKVYSPNDRDAAEKARGHFLERIVEIPGAESVRILEDLANQAESEARRDRFLVLAEQRRARNIETEVMSPQAFTQLRYRGEFPPRTANEFYQLVLDKADDVRVYLEGDDDQQKSLIRVDQNEHSVQIKLKVEFERIAHDLYNVYREAEIGERNSPDLIISSNAIAAEVAIEIKVADNGYTIKNFVDIIHNQLIGKYLRMPNRREHGILIITYHGEKSYWQHPKTRARVHFPELIELLRLEASDALIQAPHVQGLGVLGIDLTDQTH